MAIFGRKRTEEPSPPTGQAANDALPAATRPAAPDAVPKEPPPADATRERENAAPKEERRRDYEVTLILSAAPKNDDRERFIEKIRGVIADGDGELIEVGQPRQQQLAYPIRKERRGIYVTLAFRGPSTLPETIAGTFRHDRTLLRSIIVERPRRREAADLFGTKRAQRGTQMDEQIEAALSKMTDRP